MTHHHGPVRTVGQPTRILGSYPPDTHLREKSQSQREASHRGQRRCVPCLPPLATARPQFYPVGGSGEIGVPSAHAMRVAACSTSAASFARVPYVQHLPATGSSPPSGMPAPLPELNRKPLQMHGHRHVHETGW